MWRSTIPLLRKLPQLVREEHVEQIMTWFRRKKQLVKNLRIFHTSAIYSITDPSRLYYLLLNLWEGDVDKYVPYLRLCQMIAYNMVERFVSSTYRHVRVVIAGKSGVGKTTYALYSMWGAFRLLGLDPDTCWRAAAGLTFHDLSQFAEFVQTVLDEGLYVPAVLLDEAGLVASKYWIFSEKRVRVRIASILEMFDLLKDCTGVIIFTTPDIQNLAKRLRDIIDVKIIGQDFQIHDMRFSAFFIVRKVPLAYSVRAGKYVEAKVKTDEVCTDIDIVPEGLRLPDWLWRHHLESRKRLIMEKIEKFRQLLEKDDKSGTDGEALDEASDQL